MKYVTLAELIELGKNNPNYKFSWQPITEPGYYEDYKTYVDSDGSYIEIDILNFCDGVVDKCLDCYIIFFGDKDRHLETYQLRPTHEETIRMEEDAIAMLFEC